MAAFDLARALAVGRAEAGPPAAEPRPEKDADVRPGRPWAAPSATARTP
ncbi:hypothetical protein ACIPYS_03940 [Kitasatospora sp. NPDC089913]